jgi:hypothetical protein
MAKNPRRSYFFMAIVIQVAHRMFMEDDDGFLYIFYGVIPDEPGFQTNPA